MTLMEKIWERFGMHFSQPQYPYPNPGRGQETQPIKATEEVCRSCAKAFVKSIKKKPAGEVAWRCKQSNRWMRDGESLPIGCKLFLEHIMCRGEDYAQEKR
jgi:hypothetical protein